MNGDYLTPAQIDFVEKAGGFGQLTKQGQEQMIKAGDSLYQRHKDIFTSDFRFYNMLIRSSNHDRSKYSAVLFLHGLGYPLYDPSTGRGYRIRYLHQKDIEHDIVTGELHHSWEHEFIPIHVSDTKYDCILQPTRHSCCPSRTFARLSQSVSANKDYHELLYSQVRQEVESFLSFKMDERATHDFFYFNVADDLQCLAQMGYPGALALHEKFKYVAQAVKAAVIGDLKEHRVGGSVIIEQLLDIFKVKINQETPKLYAGYSR